MHPVPQGQNPPDASGKEGGKEVKTEDMLTYIAAHDHGYHMSDFEAKNLLEFVSNLESLLKIVKQAHENWMIRAQTAEAENEQLKTKLDFANQQLAALEAHHESDHAKHREEIEQLKVKGRKPRVK
jgi:hypothetical protein